MTSCPGSLAALKYGLRTAVLLAVVAASTAVLVEPELIGGSAQATASAIGAIPVVTHR